MVRLLTLAVAALVAFASTSTDAASVVNLPKRKFYRPCGDEVSGRTDATTLYLRSPCPALNSMANHGLLPRDGRGLTRAMLKTAVMEIFNIGEDLAVDAHHNDIEHDVSLSRRDTYFGGDQSIADVGYLIDMLSYGKHDGQLSLVDIATIRADRFADCKAENPECEYGDNRQFIANAKSGLMLRALGGQNTETIRYAHAYSFFVNGQFPSDFVKSKTPVTFSNVTDTIANLKAVPV